MKPVTAPGLHCLSIKDASMKLMSLVRRMENRASIKGDEPSKAMTKTIEPPEAIPA